MAAKAKKQTSHTSAGTKSKVTRPVKRGSSAARPAAPTRPKATSAASTKAPGSKRAKAPGAKAPGTKAPGKGARTIELERFIAASPARVFELWTTREGLALWLASKATLDVRPGGKADLVLRGFEAGRTENRFLVVEPAKRLELEWERTAKWGPTHVAVTFEAERDGTRLRLVQSGFGDGPEWDEWYEGFDAGWASFLAQLATVAEGGGARAAAILETIDRPAKDVWKLIGSPEGLARWFTSGKGKLEPRAGGRYDLTCGPVEIEGDVRAFEKDRTLAFSWSVEPCTQKALALPTVVTLHLTPLAKGGTTVSLVHSGFGDGPEWDEIYARHTETWKFLLANLKSVAALAVDQRGRSIERSLLVRATPAKAYSLFATKKGVESWFAPRAEVGSEPGSPFVLDFEGPEYGGESVHAPGRVVETKPAERFAFVWPAHGNKNRPTLVTVNFKAEAGGTRITLVESGFGRGAEWDAAYLEHKEGWGYELNKLFVVLEGLGERGRSIQLEKSLAASPDAVWKALVARANGQAVDLAPGAAIRFTQVFEAAGEVREAVAGESLAYSLASSATHPLPAPVLVTFTLAALRSGGTRLTIAGTGFGAKGAWAGAHAACSAALGARVLQLAAALGEGS